MMTRKIIAASWTIPLYALLLSIVEFSQQTLVETSFLDSVSGFLLLCTIYMAYSRSLRSIQLHLGKRTRTTLHKEG